MRRFRRPSTTTVVILVILAGGGLAAHNCSCEDEMDRRARENMARFAKDEQECKDELAHFTFDEWSSTSTQTISERCMAVAKRHAAQDKLKQAADEKRADEERIKNAPAIKLPAGPKPGALLGLTRSAARKLLGKPTSSVANGDTMQLDGAEVFVMYDDLGIVIGTSFKPAGYIPTRDEPTLLGWAGAGLGTDKTFYADKHTIAIVRQGYGVDFLDDDKSQAIAREAARKLDADALEQRLRANGDGIDARVTAYGSHHEVLRITWIGCSSLALEKLMNSEFLRAAIGDAHYTRVECADGYDSEWSSDTGLRR